MCHEPGEARLRPEFARSYPPLRPDVWESAAVVTEKVIAWCLQHWVGDLFRKDRVLTPEHFEFRGENNVPRVYQTSRASIGSTG